jgi:hypothetical protein
MKKNYSFRISRHKNSINGSHPQFSMACFLSSSEGGAMESVTFASWSDLAAALSSVHCNDSAIATTKKSLDEEGAYTLADVWLEDDQVQRLGLDPENCSR